MKKRILLGLALVPLALASCGANGRAGIYSFQMGKTSGAFVSANMTLTDEPYLLHGENHGKKMTLMGQMRPGPKEESSGSSESSASSSNPGTLSDTMLDMFEKGVSVNGYYIVGDARGKDRNQLSIGFDISTLPIFADVAESIPEIESSVIEQFIFCEIDARKIYLQIPVSFEDLALQLYWYGTDLGWLLSLDLASLFEDDSSQESSSGQDSSSSSDSSGAPQIVAHEIGSKPTPEDVEEINKVYPQHHNGKMFRNFYTVSLALTRQN